MDASQVIWRTLSALSLYDWTTIAALLLALTCFSTYAITTATSALALRSKKNGKDPPVVPYFLPLLGNSISLIRDTPGFIDALT